MQGHNKKLGLPARRPSNPPPPESSFPKYKLAHITMEVPVVNCSAQLPPPKKVFNPPTLLPSHLQQFGYASAVDLKGVPSTPSPYFADTGTGPLIFAETRNMTVCGHPFTSTFLLRSVCTHRRHHHHHHHHHHPPPPPLAAEQAITSFLQAHRSLARVTISSAAISFSSYPNTHWM